MKNPKFHAVFEYEKFKMLVENVYVYNEQVKVDEHLFERLLQKALAQNRITERIAMDIINQTNHEYVTENCCFYVFTPIAILPTFQIGEHTLYEGVILKDKIGDDEYKISCFYPVEFQNGMFVVNNSFKDETPHYVPVFQYFGTNLKIAGNIYENPELI